MVVVVDGGSGCGQWLIECGPVWGDAASAEPQQYLLSRCA